MRPKRPKPGGPLTAAFRQGGSRRLPGSEARLKVEYFASRIAKTDGDLYFRSMLTCVAVVQDGKREVWRGSLVDGKPVEVLGVTLEVQHIDGDGRLVLSIRPGT